MSDFAEDLSKRLRERIALDHPIDPDLDLNVGDVVHVSDSDGNEWDLKVIHTS